MLLLAKQQIAPRDGEAEALLEQRRNMVLDGAVIAEIDEHHRVALLHALGLEVREEPPPDAANEIVSPVAAFPNGSIA